MEPSGEQVVRQYTSIKLYRQAGHLARSCLGREIEVSRVISCVWSQHTRVSDGLSGLIILGQREAKSWNVEEFMGWWTAGLL